MAAGRKEVGDSEQKVVCSLTPSGSLHLDEHELDKRVSLGLKQMRPRSDSSPVDPTVITLFHQSHFKPIPQARKCASPSCGKKLSKKLPKKLGQCRNCSMCGDVFCYQCTNYRRRLSLSACPDDLFGILQSVCSNCFRRYPLGFHRDHTSEFKQYRKEMIATHIAEAEKTLCCSKYTPAKRNAILKAVNRLVEGYKANSGWLSKFLSEFEVPDWQKPPNWVDSSSVNHCYKCNKELSSITSTKINCRIGGQVFCKDCGKYEIMIYCQDKTGLPQWGINGKGLMRKPAKLELYPICSGCTGDLETILLEKKELDLLHQKDAFMADVLVVQENLSHLQRKIDKWLPDYQQAVGALDYQPSDITKNKKLAKLHLDIRDIISVVVHKFDKDLLNVHPQSAIQDPRQLVLVLWHIRRGVYLNHVEHLSQYSYTHKQLVQHFTSYRDPSGSEKRKGCGNSSKIDHKKSAEELERHLVSTQRILSQQSMESVYIEISLLIHDLYKNYRKHFDVDSIMLETMMKIIQSIMDELSPFLSGNSCEDLEHFKLAMMNRESRMNVSEHLKSDLNTVRIVVVKQCSVILHECYLQLQAESLDQEFLQTKRLLNETVMKLESMRHDAK